MRARVIRIAIFGSILVVAGGALVLVQTRESELVGMMATEGARCNDLVAKLDVLTRK